MLPYTALNPVDISYARFLAQDESDRQRAIRRARAYHSGAQFVYLTDRLREFLADSLARGNRASIGDADILRLNICHTIVRAVVERLIVERFTSGNEALDVWAASTWQRNRMDARADDAHEWAVRDGEAFVLVSWDNDAGIARFTPHPRYVDATDQFHLLDGDGYGIQAYYQDDDDNGTMLYAVKRWYEVIYDAGQRKTRQRATIYYPNRIEKYEVKLGGLEQITDPADNGVWPLPWVDATGQPLGIPVIHFKNPGLGAEAWEAIPLQNAVNKTLVDLLASSDLTAFRILIALGFNPVDADGNPLSINPGSWIGTTSKDASVQVVDGADLNNQIGLLDSLIAKAAMVTDTPISRFTLTRAVAAEGTQKQQEGPLLGKIRKRQVLLGNAWEDCLCIARRLHNVFSTEAPLDETALVSCQWKTAEVRDEDAEMGRFEAKQRLGIPQQQIWSEMGYDAEQITQFAKLKQQAEDREAARTAALASRAMPMQTGNTNQE